MDFLARKNKKLNSSEFLQAFIQSWELHGIDEASICSGTLDLVRAYLGDRPCCIWKLADSPMSSLYKISERGMIDLFFNSDIKAYQSSLNRAVVSGVTEFDPCPISSLSSELKMGMDGFLHIPIKVRDGVMGLFTLAVTKKESRDRDFVQPLESLARLVGIAIQQGLYQEDTVQKQRRLKAEVEATTRELEQTNKTLIDRVRELKTLYQELQKRVQELTAANRAKDEFLSIVSHELRTPLTSLTGFLAVLLEEDAGPVKN
jgi:signal transduction histidine kinase